MEKVIGLLVLTVLTIGLISYAVMGNTLHYKDISDSGISEYNRQSFSLENNILSRDKALELFRKRDILKFDVMYICDNNSIGIRYASNNDYDKYKFDRIIESFKLQSKDVMYKIAKRYEKDGRLFLTFEKYN